MLKEWVVKQKTECAHFTRLWKRRQLVKSVYEWEKIREKVRDTYRTKRKTHTHITHKIIRILAKCNT